MLHKAGCVVGRRRDRGGAAVAGMHHRCHFSAAKAGYACRGPEWGHHGCPRSPPGWPWVCIGPRRGCGQQVQRRERHGELCALVSASSGFAVHGESAMVVAPLEQQGHCCGVRAARAGVCWGCAWCAWRQCARVLREVRGNGITGLWCARRACAAPARAWEDLGAKQLCWTTTACVVGGWRTGSQARSRRQGRSSMGPLWGSGAAGGANHVCAR